MTAVINFYSVGWMNKNNKNGFIMFSCCEHIT